MSSDLVEIDGSLLEGGGQILRIALTLSAIKKIPVRITNIRAGRSKPGLMEQHLKGVELIRDICSGHLTGGNIGSTEVKFRPGVIKGGNFSAFVKTAGSVSLLLQVALPCLLFADCDSVLRLRGGTNCDMAPQIDYTTEVFRPILEKFGTTFDFDLMKRGYFPKGGGEIIVKIPTINTLNPMHLTQQGRVSRIYGWSFVAGTLPLKLSHLMADSATSLLKTIGNQINIERYKENIHIAPDNCSGIILVAETDTGCILGSSALGKRNERAEETGKRAAEELIQTIKSGACVDDHAQDQIIVLMALANGKSSVKIGEMTMHTKTAIFVVEKLTNVKFEVCPDGLGYIISCTGV